MNPTIWNLLILGNIAFLIISFLILCVWLLSLKSKYWADDLEGFLFNPLFAVIGFILLIVFEPVLVGWSYLLPLEGWEIHILVALIVLFTLGFSTHGRNT